MSTQRITSRASGAVIDTAGLRERAIPWEKLGIARTLAAIGKADLVLVLLDATGGESAADRAILAQLPGALPRITVMNKIDLAGRAPAIERVDGATRVWLSAKTGAGVSELRQAILEVVGWRADGEGCNARYSHGKIGACCATSACRAGGESGRCRRTAPRPGSLGAITWDYTRDLLGGSSAAFA